VENHLLIEVRQQFYCQIMQAILRVAVGASDHRCGAYEHGRGFTRSDRRGRDSRGHAPRLSEADTVPHQWERSLEQIPTVFGKLVFVAEFLNELSGKYWHRGLASLMDDDAVDRLIRRRQMSLFGEWLRMDAASQIDDLAAYCSSAAEGPRQTLVACSGLAMHMRLVPAGASDQERLRYLTQVDHALDHLYGRGELAPTAIPDLAADEGSSTKDCCGPDPRDEGLLQTIRRGCAWLAAAPVPTEY
jgi:hypothetical protein